eukprot:TRINITY_DN57_c0_g1_i2.p1 TRINITY_DN57_c0_g1~~TRINITY_DN57_c0_g1_i2.p1  ORF type:complete len:538 (+),score=138.17 TRINITY_DN57_c0_g1_i2:50-1663(+)
MATPTQTLTQTATLFNQDLALRLIGEIEGLEERKASVDEGVNIAWLLFGASLVFFMQAGFAMLESGTVRTWNVTSILFKNTMDGVLSAALFWMCGWGFSYGTSNAETSFIGAGQFFLISASPSDTNLVSGGPDHAGWLFQWAFAATAATIVSGAVAERCRLGAYFVYTILLIAIIYPVVVHWGWSSCGWASAFNDGSKDCFKFGQLGVIDFAGSGVVHMTGGFSALAGSVMLGPRRGRLTGEDSPAELATGYRFEKGVADDQFNPHSIPQQALGVFILWFGWYGFNCVSTLAITGGAGAVAAKVAATTTMGAAMGGLGALIFNRILVAFKKRTTAYDISTLLNGILGGLVSITAGCAVVEPWAAVVIGIVGGMTYVGASAMLKGLEIDDPLDAFPVHGACGIWGVISVGIFANSQNVYRAYGTSLLRDGKYLDGFYDQADGGNQFDVQLLFALCVALWSFSASFITFYILSKLNLLRVSAADEERGLDAAEGMGAAYEMKQIMEKAFPEKNVASSSSSSSSSSLKKNKEAKEVKESV